MEVSLQSGGDSAEQPRVRVAMQTHVNKKGKEISMTTIEETVRTEDHRKLACGYEITTHTRHTVRRYILDKAKMTDEQIDVVERIARTNEALTEDLAAHVLQTMGTSDAARRSQEARAQRAARVGSILRDAVGGGEGSAGAMDEMFGDM